MSLTTGAQNIFRDGRANRLAALRMRRFRRRNREAERNAKRNAKRLARRMETGEAEINSYADIVRFMIGRRLTLGLSQLALDDLCGFSSGFISHLEHPETKNGRVAGSATMHRWFTALGVRFKPIVEMPDGVREEPLPDELSHRKKGSSWQMAALFKNRQWTVTAYGMECRSPYRYDIEASRLLEMGYGGLYDWPIHMAEKEWVDIEAVIEAFTKALELHQGNYIAVADPDTLAKSIDFARKVRERMDRRALANGLP